LLNNSLLLHHGKTAEQMSQIEKEASRQDDKQTAKIFSFVFIIAFVIVPFILIIGLFVYKLIK